MSAYSVDILDSTNKNKKLMAIFYDENGKKIKTTHFGASGYEDYTIHKDKERRLRYVKRHEGKEDWNDPMKAGTLSLYILWGPYTDLNKCIKYYKKEFGLK